MTPPARAGLLAIGLILTALAPRAAAQELEPRLWSNLPVGANFLGVGYGFSSGNILLDPSLPVEDADAEVNSVSVRYLRAIGVGGLSGAFDVLVPLSSGTWEGIVNGQPAKTSRHGMGDPRIRFMVNFLGAPALRRPEFAKFRAKTIAGASLQIILPLGEYIPSKLINLGSNRYTLCPQIGFSHAFERLAFEVTGTAWFFTDNDDFFGGSTLEQDPLYALQTHVFYTFKPGLWVGLDAGVADGGQSFVDGEPSSSIEQNTRYGATLSIPIDRRQGFKVSVSTGLATRIGADFTTYAIGYQYMWGGA